MKVYENANEHWLNTVCAAVMNFEIEDETAYYLVENFEEDPSFSEAKILKGDELLSLANSGKLCIVEDLGSYLRVVGTHYTPEDIGEIQLITISDPYTVDAKTGMVEVPL